MKTPTLQEIESVREAVDIVDIVMEHTLLVSHRGSVFRANCPFHPDEECSFYVNRKRQQYYCFGCRRGGDVIRFVMELKSMDLAEAMRVLMVDDEKHGA